MCSALLGFQAFKKPSWPKHPERSRSDMPDSQPEPPEVQTSGPINISFLLFCMSSWMCSAFWSFRAFIKPNWPEHPKRNRSDMLEMDAITAYIPKPSPKIKFMFFVLFCVWHLSQDVFCTFGFPSIHRAQLARASGAQSLGDAEMAGTVPRNPQIRPNQNLLFDCSECFPGFVLYFGFPSIHSA